MIFVDWYLPGYKAGGPIKSVSSLVAFLQNEFDFLIVTTNTDFGETQPYDSVVSDVWTKTNDSVSVFYASKKFLTYKNISQLVKSVEFDGVYLNSFFSIYFSVIPLFLLKKGIIKTSVLIAPRGMLGVGALQLKSTKKRIFLLISKLIRLHKNVIWHATSEQERGEIAAIFGEKANISMVSNLQFNASISTSMNPYKNIGELKLFFLSRISEKKNLLFALRSLLNIKVTSNVVFDIYGPIEDGAYWKKCLPLIEELKRKNISVNYMGSVLNEKVSESIATYHFLFLPTLNENFGHVIVESLLNGKPVIISNQTPWRDLEKYNVGWDISLDNISKFDKVIEYCIQMDNSTYEKKYRDTLQFAELYCNSLDNVAATRMMFNKLT